MNRGMTLSDGAQGWMPQQEGRFQDEEEENGQRSEERGNYGVSG